MLNYYLIMTEHTIDICVICRNDLVKPCIMCEVKDVDKKSDPIICPVIRGRCGHQYHTSCIDKWLINRIVCPLDNKVWRDRSISKLSTLCHNIIAINIELTLEVIVNCEFGLTTHDWEEIRKISESPENMYSFKKPKHICKDAIKVLEAQFKTVSRPLPSSPIKCAENES